MCHEIYDTDMDTQLPPDVVEMMRRAAILVEQERQKSFAMGLSIVSRDPSGILVEELADGTKFEIEFVTDETGHTSSRRLRVGNLTAA
jgi:hypothetical protein